MKTNIKYKTKRQRDIWASAIFMALCLCWGAGGIVDEELCPLFMVPFVWLLAVSPFIYCMTYDLKRKKYKEKGKRIPARIIGYYSLLGGRSGGNYYLKIQFLENGKKVFVTESYADDPNDKLANTSCYIYNYNGKYIEADLNTLKKGEKPRGLNIPIVNEGVFPKIKSGSVTVVEQTKDEKG